MPGFTGMMHIAQQQQQQQQQQQAGMMPIAQQQQQQQAGMGSQAQMALQQQGSSQQMQQGSMQQPSYMQGMYGQQGMMQQPGAYPTMAQSNPSSAAEQSSRPMSPPGLPRGPLQPAGAAQRSQIKSSSGGFLGPRMIRPQMAANPMMVNQMAGSQMAGQHMMANQLGRNQMRGHQIGGSQLAGNQMAANQMGGSQMAGNEALSPKSPSALRSASPRVAAAPSSNGVSLTPAPPQLGPQLSNSGISRPNSASNQEAATGSGQSHGALMPQGRAGPGQAEAAASQPSSRYPGGQGPLQMPQAGYGNPAYGNNWNGSMQTGMSQPPTGMMQGTDHAC